MNTITRLVTPEEAELERYLRKLEGLQGELAEQEEALETLKAVLEAFAERFRLAVGVKYALLDALEARIAEIEAAMRPADSAAQAAAETARARATDSARQAQVDDPAVDGDGRRAPPAFQPAEDLKALFREIAKKVHPDLALDPEEKARRTRWMQEANDAYRRGDGSALRRLLEQIQHSPEVIEGMDIAARLIRAIRQIAQAESRLQALKAEIAALAESDLGQLHGKVQDASREGRDLLSEMFASVDALIAAAQARLTTLQNAQAEGGTHARR